MAELGQGTLVAGRYRLDEPARSDIAGIKKWLAVDRVLERPVWVVLFDGERPGEALDAARRAALVEDDRLARIIDAGQFEGATYVVTERVSGQPLTDVLRHGPIMADQARAIVGEIAEALEISRRRGVYHLVLRPDAIYCTDDGGVVLTGLGYEAGMLGLDTAPPHLTARADAMGLVALIYAALTGRWPGALPPGVDANRVEQAPVIGGSPVPPGELVPGVPNDLDTMCSVTFGPNQDGPHTPGEVARELAPWPAVALGTDLIMTDDQPTELAEPPVAPEPTPQVPARQSFRTHLASTTGPAASAPVVVGGSRARMAAAAPGAGQTWPPAASGPAGPGPVNPSGPFPPLVANVNPVPPPSTPGAGPAAPGSPGTFGPAQPPAAPGYAQSAARPPAQRPPAQRPPAQRPPAQRPPGRSPKRRTDPGKWILALVGIVVLIVLVVAFKTLFSPTQPRETDAKNTPAPSITDTPSPTTSEPTPTETSQSPSGLPPKIASATALDPDGDGEHPETQGNAVDGDPNTSWRTRWYNDPKMPGKSGIGLAISLEERADVSRVQLTVDGVGGNVQVRATDAANPTGGALLAEGPFSPTTVFDFEPTEATTVVLWITELPVASDENNRVAIFEVDIS